MSNTKITPAFIKKNLASIIISLLMACGIMWYVSHRAVQETTLRLAPYKTPATAVVTDVSDYGRITSIRHAYTVKYATEKGDSLTGRIDYVYLDKCSIGDKIAIRYNPAKPDDIVSQTEIEKETNWKSNLPVIGDLLKGL